GEVRPLADDLGVVDAEGKARRASLPRVRDQAGRRLEDTEQARLARIRDIPKGRAAARGLMGFDQHAAARSDCRRVREALAVGRASEVSGMRRVRDVENDGAEV